MTSASDLSFKKCKWIPQSLEQKHSPSSSKKKQRKKATETGFEDFSRYNFKADLLWFEFCKPDISNVGGGVSKKQIRGSKWEGLWGKLELLDRRRYWEHGEKYLTSSWRCVVTYKEVTVCAGRPGFPQAHKGWVPHVKVGEDKEITQS